MAQDTIYALSSGPGRSAIAVVRLSGALSHQVIRDITKQALPAPRNLVRRDVFNADGEIIDEAMICLLPDGKSFTGEPMAEIHCHGSPAIVHQVNLILGHHEGCRPAEPGEFSLRAFKSGRMDLAEVEGLADLISAQTEQQRREAMRLVRGEASRRTDHWRERLIHALALLEVTIDWADEEVPEDVVPDVREILTQMQKDFKTELDLAEQSEKLRNGFTVAILGAPNVGKSTLINALSGRDAAITSDTPGTTRDIIEVAFDLRGLPVRFMDTAGLRTTEDAVEAEGVARARRAAVESDLRVFLHASDVPEEDNADELWRDGDLRVQTKTDLFPRTEEFGVSAKTGDGLQALLDQISDALGDRYQSFGLFGHERRRSAIQRAQDCLGVTLETLEETDLELVAENLRLVLFQLDCVIGRVGVEDVLGSVFSRFCLGK